jgi:hypothetical protein
MTVYGFWFIVAGSLGVSLRVIAITPVQNNNKRKTINPKPNKPDLI